MSGVRLLAVLAGLLAIAVSAPASAHDDDDDDDAKCRHFDGPFVSVTVAPPECKSPVGLCTHGILSGDMDATYDFTVETIAPDPNDPTALDLTGTSVITTKNGQMFTNDVSILRPTGPFTPSPFVTTAVVQSGTHHWKHTSGKFVASGNLILATGQSVGSYTADLCKNEH